MTFLYVVLGSALGAPARYLADRSIQRHAVGVFPLGTFTINVSGSFLFGLLVGSAADAGLAEPMVAGIGAGFLGSYTTFSTFVWDSLRLAQDGSVLVSSANIVLSVVAGAAAAALGLAIQL